MDPSDSPASESTSCGSSSCGCRSAAKDTTTIGVVNPGSLDCVAEDPVSGEAVLIMMETRPWNGSSRHLFELQEKINAYLSFALDGEMAETHPHLIGKKLRLQLDTVEEPDPRTRQFIDVIRGHLEPENISLKIHRLHLSTPAAIDSVAEEGAKAAMI